MSDSVTYHSGKEINDALNRVKNVDELPTKDSKNLVSSGGVYSAINSLNTSQVTSLKDYSKPETTSALSPDDTLNQALGKLEKAVESSSKSTAGNVVAVATVD